MIGWAAVTGSVDVVPLLLFAIVFFWTPPHFWSLALWAHDDYERAGVPMLPVVAGARETRRQIVLYTLLLVPLSLLPCALRLRRPDLRGHGAGARRRVPVEVDAVSRGPAGRARGQPDQRRAGKGGVQVLDRIICSRCSARLPSTGWLADPCRSSARARSRATLVRRRRGRNIAMLVALLIAVRDLLRHRLGEDDKVLSARTCATRAIARRACRRGGSAWSASPSPRSRSIACSAR